jgi:phosphoribosylamine--glycine ligase
MTNILVVGSGGREQALAWKIAQSQSVNKVYVAPGNAGSKGKVNNIDINFTNGPALLEFAKNNGVDLTVIGQEAASEAGVVDLFIQEGLTIFGPTKAAARIETSKSFSKDIMSENNIPTARYKNFKNPDEAKAYAKNSNPPIVIKADGLATGKGVVIARNETEIDAAIDDIMIKKIFGDSGDQVVVEDYLEGQEVSMHALCDGTTTVMFPPSQDHKQIFDGDKGANTGGMGAYAPVSWISDEQVKFVRDKAVQPALNGLRSKGEEFKGCLYPGLMINGQDIKLLEFNARFGDPETEIYMRLLEGDLYEILRACAMGNLDPTMVSWQKGFAVTVVVASPGYPGDYPKGLPISGIEEAEKQDDIVVFHAGTATKDGQLVTAGGRVLNITSTGANLAEAIQKAYKAVSLIYFEGMHYRTDIGRRV